MRTHRLLCTVTLLSAAAAAEDCLPWQDGPKPQGADAGEQARAFLRKAARDHPSDPHEHMRLGQMLFDGKCYDLALSELLRARAQGEGGFEILAKLASTENIAGAFNDAAADADGAAQAASSSGERASANALAGVAFESAGQDDFAIARFQRSLSLEPKQESSSLELAKLLDRKGRQTEAAAALEKHVVQYPASVEAWARLAAVQAALHNVKRALACWTAVERLKPDYPMVGSMRAQAMLAQEQPDANAILRVLAKAQAGTPQDADLFYLEGKAWLILGRHAEAAKAFETAVRLRPLERGFRYQLGLAYGKLGRADLARREFAVMKRLRATDANP